MVRALVFLSDGRDTSSLNNREQAAAYARERKVQLYALGVGDVYEEDELRAAALETEGSYYRAQQFAGLEDQLETIVGDLRGQYKISYITLRRAGWYQARVSVTLRGAEGNFHTETFDVARFFGPDNRGVVPVRSGLRRPGHRSGNPLHAGAPRPQEHRPHPLQAGNVHTRRRRAGVQGRRRAPRRLVALRTGRGRLLRGLLGRPHRVRQLWAAVQADALRRHRRQAPHTSGVRRRHIHRWQGVLPPLADRNRPGQDVLDRRRHEQDPARKPRRLTGRRRTYETAIPIWASPGRGRRQDLLDRHRDGQIQRANLDGSEVEDIVTSGLDSPHGIALDVAAGKIYWTDWKTNRIQRANLDGSEVEDIVTSGLRLPAGIALDVAAGKMYWTAAGTDKIQRANLDGSVVEDLVTSGLRIPLRIALDVAAGKMYWTAPGTDKIQRANLDGSVVEDLVTSGLRRPLSIALDVAAGKMYWTDAGTDKIQRANLDGSAVEDLVTGLKDPIGIALDLD